MEVPGLEPDSLRVCLRDRSVVVSGERRPRHAGTARSSAWSARTAASSGRSSSTGPSTSPTPGPRLGGGLLTVTLPPRRERRGREILVPIEREPAE